MAVELTDEDLEFLLDLVNNEAEARDSSGHGNNVANPTWGAADQPFIRLTDPSYADGLSAPRQTQNTPREISDILVNQDTDGNGVEESIPNEFGGNAFLTFFGQYFDHGLDFVGKSGSTAIGSAGFPINAQRANIAPGTGNADGVAGTADDVAAQHINKTSPFVDQNQAYGSHDSVTDLLRRWELGDDGQKQQTAYLLTGDTDATGRDLLPTLNHIRENYRVMTDGGELTAADISNFDGTGQALLLDFIPAFTPTGQLDLDAIGHYFIAGDGRANENVMLTSIHTIWARNHNFWVDELKAKTGGAWSEEQYFEAARVINIAEYQRVVFTEFADAMAGGLNGGGSHGFGGYDPEINAAISAEFAHVAYRFGHSMLNETVSYVDGATGELTQTSLINAFLNPQNVAQLGVANLIQGSTVVEHQAIDVHVVNALRNQLVGRPLDLAALNIFRGRDTGVGTFNEVRADLFARTGDDELRPYEGWDDFQDRNDISDADMAKLKAAYPEGFEAVDLWVGGLMERPREGQLGSTFAYIFLEQLDRLQEGDRFYYLHQLDDADFRDQINDQTFAEIVARNTGLTGLPANIFQATPLSSTPPTEEPPAEEPPVGAPGEGPDEIAGTPGDDEIDGLGGNDTIAGGEGNDDLSGGTGHDELSGDAGNDRLDGGAGNDILAGGAGSDELHGGAGNDDLSGGAGNDELHGGAGNDALSGGDGHDALHGDAGSDVLEGGAGNDALQGGADDDDLSGGAGDDELFGEAGDDMLAGGGGDDALDGGEGTDIAAFSGSRAEYDIATDANGVTTITHRNGGADGTDTLTGIERLQFADDSIDTPPASPGEEEEPDSNVAPTATVIANQTAQPGAQFLLNAASHFADADAGDTLTYSMTGPSWLSIDAQTGVITGTPPSHIAMQNLTADANGNYAVSGGLVQISTAFFAPEAGYHNSFGYYVADASGKPLGGAIIETVARETAGDHSVTVDLGAYPGAASLGFFLIPNGAGKNPGLADGQAVTFQQSGGEWHAWKGGAKLAGEGASVYFTNAALNSDGFDHMKDAGFSGNQNWEDLRGGGDKDYDDANINVAVKALQLVPDVAGGVVTVKATDAGGLSAQTSFAIAVPPVAAAQQHLAGTVEIQDSTPADGALTAAEGQPLTANLHLLMNPEGISEIRYQWQSSSDGVNWNAIPGATNNRFTPRQSEAGLALRVALTYIFVDAAFSSQTVHSAPTAPVTPAQGESSGHGQGNEQPGSGTGNQQGDGGQDCGDDGHGAPSGGNHAHQHGDGQSEEQAATQIIEGSSSANFLFGGRGVDQIFAKAGSDHVFAGRGDDVIHGGDGDDMLFGGKGDDFIYGGTGDDHLFGGDGDDALYGEEGDDALFGQDGEDTLDGAGGDDTLYGGDDADTLSGGAGEDELHGGADDDVLAGGADADMLFGDAGDDMLDGGAGDDTLYGGKGDDLIAGGLGDDVLHGGKGRDTFLYRSGDGNDEIADFEEDCDELQIEADATTYTVSQTDYGRDYVFVNGQVLAVRGNSGHGSQNSGSGNSGSRSSDRDNSGHDNAHDSAEDAWAELIAAGVVDQPDDPIPAGEDYAPLSELYDDPGLPALGISTIPLNHEDLNLIA
jgi:Ca2+-binding RTX toxin-like protein